MPLNPDARTLLTMMAQRSSPVHELTPQTARDQQRRRSTWANGEPEPVARVFERSLPVGGDPATVRVYVPEISDGLLPMLAFFHGGGWVTCDLDSHDVLCRALALRAGCIVVAVDYPLAPEHKFPAGLDVCWGATTWLAEHGAELGGDPRRLAVCGDSAGGNLAAVVALRARTAGLRLALQVLLYPSVDYRLDDVPDAGVADGYGLTIDGLRFYYENYLRTPADARDPEVSPYLAPDLSGVAPAYVVSCEFDPIRPEIEQYAGRLVEAGVPVHAHRYLGQIHGFIRATAVIGEAWDALDDIGRALRVAFDTRNNPETFQQFASNERTGAS